MRRRIFPLDGLRGAAVLFVLFGHYVPLEWGWTGVEIFFVLSGYLITTILLAEREEEHFWKIFYTRRFTRLIPAYLTALLAAALFFPIPWRHVWFYYVLPLANIPPITQYYLQIPGLGVMWSLTVEEQFYFIWPIQVRKFQKSTLVYILVSILILEPIARGVATHYIGPWQIYVSTPFRLDGLAAGSLLAVFLSRYPNHPRSILASRAAIGTGFALLLYAALGLHWKQSTSSWPKNAFLYSILILISVGIVSLVLHRPDGILGRCLSIRPLLFVAKISYGLYLYQLITIFALARLAEHMGYHEHLGRMVKIPAFILSICAAWLSSRYIESPVHAWGKRITGSLKDDALVVAARRNVGALDTVEP